MDNEKLLKALDDENNAILMKYTSKQFNQIKLNEIHQLHLPKETVLDYMQKLKDYIYVDELTYLKIGCYLRWIPIDDPEHLPLKQGAILGDILVNEKNEVSLVLKNFSHKHFSIKFDECLVFQKLTEQQKVLMSVVDHLST